jgi:glutathione synthase/RimK-type ligase-like ATP-grasp enzyme
MHVIQIYGCRTDPHVASVAQHLQADGCASRILDIFDPTSDGLSETITPRLELSLAAAINDSQQPRVIWWRIKPAFYISTTSIVSYYNQQFAFAEWMATLNYMSALHKDCAWVNPRASSRIASNKIHQLEVASRLGFTVPRTVFTNNAKTVLNFISSLNGGACIHKTITPYICPDARQKYTGFIDAGTVSTYAKEIESCPSIYQEHIKPKYELRITAVEDQFYAVRINKKNAAEPDWRNEMMDDIYEPYELCDSFRDKLASLQRAFGLVFGAYDFVVTEDGDVVYLEVNPAGQWLWLEEKLDLPISHALAQCLISRCSAGTVEGGRCPTNRTKKS